ncbi:MAG: hypothetical protein ACYTGZ_02025 [Planctomycetota bacterium]|jgi:hypothetical protein
MRQFRLLIVFIWLASVAPAADLPQGKLPKIDGIVEPEEWKNAYKASVPEGTAYLRVAGQALCLAIRIERPYAGERIDLHVADRAGAAVTQHRLHPACYLPKPPFSPLPPVMARRGSWEKIFETPYAAAYSAKIRSSVLKVDEKSWSAEFCIALEALDIAIHRPAGFHLAVVKPFSRGDRPLALHPSRWEPLNAKWDAKAGLFSTPDENKVHERSLALFRESVDRMMNKQPASPVLGAALDGALDRKRTDTLLAERAFEVRVDPTGFHGLWYRQYVLRRANRFAEAEDAYKALVKQLPGARRLVPVVQERNAMLLVLCRFDDFERENLGMSAKAADWLLGLRSDWEREGELRKKEAKGAAPRLALETTRGKIVIQLFSFSEAGYAEKLAGWLKASEFAKSEGTDSGGLGPKWVTGCLGVAVPGLPKDARCEKGGPARRAWRGTASIANGGLLVLATGQYHLIDQVCAIGRIVEGMEHLDAFAASDKILSAKVLPAAARGSGD